MKINVEQAESKAYKIPVWRGVIKGGLVFRSGKLDWKQSTEYAHYKTAMRNEERLEKNLEKWSASEGF